MMKVRMLRALAAALLIAAAAPVSGLAGPAPADPRAAGQPADVDINRAGVEELETLPGIGPSLAARIVRHRDENGPFRKVEDLLAVKGIGPKLLAKLRPHLVVGAAKRDGKG